VNSAFLAFRNPLLSSAYLLILEAASHPERLVMLSSLILRLLLFFLLLIPAVLSGLSAWAENQVENTVVTEGSGSAPAPVIMKELPAMLAEGSNKCEIVSCGMGLKETCQISCPADKTPKCSCDCIRNIGPMCMEYKANCRCE
jgi:hypothetical protein